MNYTHYEPQSGSEPFENFIRRHSYVAVAKELLAGKQTLHKKFDADVIGDDMQFADLCRRAGITSAGLNVIGCAYAIAEMVLLYDWPVAEDDLEGNFKILVDSAPEQLFPPFVTGMSFPIFMRAWHAVRPHINDIYDVWMRDLRRDLIRQHRKPGWQAEMFPLFH